MAYTPPGSVKPFNLNISDEDFAEFTQLLQLSRIGPLTYEASQTEGVKFGITQEWIIHAKDYWLNRFDWRSREKYINTFPNYIAEIEGLSLHFIALFSENKIATPIMLMHGWPGSFIEFLPLAGLVREKYLPKDQPYHIIIPSLPGYTLSGGGPVAKDWTMPDSARVLHTLMLNLGFERYLVQGGDVGCFLATIIANTYDQCIGVHLNMMSSDALPDESTLTEFEKKAVQRAREWRERDSAYALEHGSRPATIGLVVNSNPLSLLAWIGEKFLEWSDKDPSLDDILTNISLYWFTHSFPRSIYPYRGIFSGTYNPPPYITKPLGFSWFPAEIFPGVKGAVEKQGNLVFYRKHKRGGHFAALERPKDFLQDVEDFVKVVWKG